MDPEVLKKLHEKLHPSIERLSSNKHDDHDILPALLWSLLNYDDDIQKKSARILEQQESYKNAFGKQIESLSLSVRQNQEALERLNKFSMTMIVFSVLQLIAVLFLSFFLVFK